MDAAVDLGQGVLEVPIELGTIILLILEALKLDNQVELEFGWNPRGKFKGDVLGATVAPQRPD